MRSIRTVARAGLLAAVAASLVVSPVAARGPRPANDARASAVSVSTLPFSATVDVSRLTREPTDPGPYCVNGGSVWYRYDSPDRRILTVSASGGTIPTAVEIYRIHEADLLLQGCSYGFMETAPSFEVDAGATYLFMLGPSDATATRGTVSLTLSTPGDPPAHDVKAGALRISVGETLESDSTGGTRDADDFSPCSPNAGATMWHRVDATVDGRLGVSVSAGGYSPVANVGRQTATGIEALACINGSDVPIFFEVTAGSTYWILTANATGLAGGPYSLSLFDAPRIVPTVAIGQGSVDRSTGAATISGTLTCSESAQIALAVLISQRDASGSNFATPYLPCGIEPTDWSVTVVPASGSFGPGPADVVAGGTAFTQFDSGSSEAESTIVLKGN